MTARLFAAFLLISLVTLAQDSQTFLSVKQTGVENFWSKFPQYDGSGSIIFILDTGVDVGVDGLLKTSSGTTKIIDVRDFTGEGDLIMYESEVSDNVFTNSDQKLTIKGADKIKSKDGNYFIGSLKESDLKNSNSGTSDLNGNGNNTDAFVFVSFIDEQNDWVTYFDINNNGDISDDKPLKDYNKRFDTFSFRDSSTLTPYSFAVNTYPEEKILSVFFDDGAHGTHCAGIAAGYLISGSSIKGVAPGANVIALKIGNNNYPGGATVTESMKKAYLFADKFSKERKEPCIISMSYGIGSELEGLSEMEKFLNNLLKKNPYLYVCLSNGNEGPGISSTGLPSSSPYVFSSGALLTSEVARDLYGAPLPKDELWNFSSRGGEVNKPDVVSPGASVSTVPNFSKGDRMQGTSMACPYSAGVMSLLLSAALKEYPGIKIPSQLLFKAVREGAVKLEGYSILDQGNGLINVSNAWEILKKYIELGEVNNFEKYSITSFAPNMPDNKAPNLYLRDGSYLTGKETFTYTVTRENLQKVKNFYRLYNLASDTDWFIPVQKKTYIRNDAPVYVNVTIDKSKIKNPGLYTSRITAYRDDKTKMPEFDLLATVVIPYEFNSTNNYSEQWKNEKVNVGIMKRYFIKAPAGQSVMTISMNKVQNEYAYLRYRLFNPDGQQIENLFGLNTVANSNNVEKNFYNLSPGVYELVVEGIYTGTNPSAYDLSISFNSIIRTDKQELTLTNRNIELLNYYDLVQSYSVTGKIEGYTESYNVDLNGRGTFTMPLTWRENEVSKRLTITLSKEDFNKVTDFSFQVIDSSGKAIVKTSLSYRTGDLEVLKSKTNNCNNCILEIIPGFANATDSMKVEIKEDSHVSGVINFSLKDSPRFSLYPSIIKTLTFNYTKPDFTLPEGTKAFGKLTFQSISEKVLYELPIEIDMR